MGILTYKQCAAVPDPAKQKAKGEVRNDGNNLALVVKVSPKGAVSRRWRFRYYRPNGNRNDLWLGHFDEAAADHMSLADARSTADAFNRMVAEGKDPAHHRALGEQQQAKEQTTLAAVSAAYLAHIAAGRRDSTLKRYQSYHRAITEGDLAKLPIGALSANLELFEAWPKRLAAAGKINFARTICQYLERVFVFGAARKYCPPYNPAYICYRELPKHQVEGHRAITEPETFGALLRAIRGTSNPVARMATEFLALTMVRAKEARAAEWCEIDFERALWTIPAARMKQKHEHIVPLSRQALAILRTMHALTGDICCARTGKNYVWMGTHVLHMNVFGRVIQDAGFADRHTPHGFRSTASTILNGDTDHAFWRHAKYDRSFCQQMIELCLAHGTPDKVAGIYDRGTKLSARAEIMQHWADRLDIMAAGLRAVEAA